MSEESFILRLQENDPTVFKELVEMHKDRVYNTCCGFVSHGVDAEDIAQEVFIEVFRSLKKYKGDSKLSTWIYRIAVNKCLDHIRKRKRKKRFAFLQSLSGDKDLSETLPATDIHPGIALENQERAKILFHAIDQLPEKQKVAFTLSKVEELSYKEICEITGYSLSSVESLIFRARKNLQKILYDYYKNDL
ncbi:RNA polymerase sigma factor [bacterium]|nr:RNA polymerase sigma factor [bacterium]